MTRRIDPPLVHPIAPREVRASADGAHSPGGGLRFAAREALAYARQGFPARRATVELEASDGPTLVLVHGHLSGPGCFDPLREALARRGHRRFLAFGYRPSGTVRGQAGALAAFVERYAPAGPVAVVGHSLGGLLARYWIQSLGAHARTRALVTLSTPHQGLPLGRWAEVVPLVRELRRDGPLLRTLREGAARLEGIPTTSIASSRDHLLRDADAARLEGAELVVVEDAGHAGLLYSAEVHRLVDDRLKAAFATPAAKGGRLGALGGARP